MPDTAPNTTDSTESQIVTALETVAGITAIAVPAVAPVAAAVAGLVKLYPVLSHLFSPEAVTAAKLRADTDALVAAQAKLEQTVTNA